MATKQRADRQAPGVDDTVNLAQVQQELDIAHRRALLALEAVKLNVISSEEAAAVVRAFIGGEG